MRNMQEYANNYIEIPFESYQVIYRRKKVIEIMRKYPHRKILEVGCGMYPLFFNFNDYEELTIVEPSRRFIDYAMNDKRYTSQIKIKEGFLEKVAGELQGNFDYIIVASLLHEVENPIQLLHALADVCSSNTVIHVNVPNAFSLHRILALQMGMISDIHEKSGMQKRMQQNSTFDLASLTSLVNENGFDVIEAGTFFPKFFSHQQMQEMMDNGIINEKILDGMYRMEKYLPEYGSEIYIQMKKRFE